MWNVIKYTEARYPQTWQHIFTFVPFWSIMERNRALNVIQAQRNHCVLADQRDYRSWPTRWC